MAGGNDYKNHVDYALQTSFTDTDKIKIDGLKYKMDNGTEVRKIYINGVDIRNALLKALKADEIITVYSLPGLKK